MNKQARIDPWPSWLGTYLQLIPSHTILVSRASHRSRRRATESRAAAAAPPKFSFPPIPPLSP
jgi:hypothetical protein